MDLQVIQLDKLQIRAGTNTAFITPFIFQELKGFKTYLHEWPTPMKHLVIFTVLPFLSFHSAVYLRCPRLLA